MSNSIVIENRTGFLEIFAWSIVVIGAIGCLIMLVQDRIVEAILTLLKNILVALIVLVIAKSDKASADIECLNRSVVIRVVQALFALGATILAGVFVWAVTASDYAFKRAIVYGMLSRCSLSDFLTLGRIVSDGTGLRVLVTIMTGVGVWYMVGFYFVWGALGRILGRVVGAVAMKASYEQKMDVLRRIYRSS